MATTPFEDIPILSLNVKIIKFWSLILVHNWRRYLCLCSAYLLNMTQWLDFFYSTGPIDIVIRNAFFLVLWFNAIIRCTHLAWNRRKFENFMKSISIAYTEIENNNDKDIRKILAQSTKESRIFSKINLFLGIIVSFGFTFYPLFTKTRILPFGIKVPGIDVYSTPYYEIFYTLCICLTAMGCCMYIPFTSLMVSFIIFGTSMIKILQYRLRNLTNYNNTTKAISTLSSSSSSSTLKYDKASGTPHGFATTMMMMIPEDEYLLDCRIIWCIKYHLKLIRYINNMNNLIMYICLIEFLSFGATLCALLFLLNIVKTIGQILIVALYIVMTLAQIFAIYWYANDLHEEHANIVEAIYNNSWFECSTAIQKKLLLIIIRAQKPAAVMLGGIYPMTLGLFQSLLNASYTYFTLLRRLYG